MTTPICGHGRETLQWALSHEKRCGQFGGFDALRRGDDHCDAWRAIHDPAKLCDMTTALLCEHGCSVYVFRRSMFEQGCPRAQFVFLYEPNEDTIDVWDGKKWRDYRSMQQIRALALALLDAPMTTAIDVERILGALV